MSDVLCVMDHGDQPAETVPGLMLCHRHRNRLDFLTSEIGLLVVDASRIRDGGAPQDAGPRGNHGKKRADPPAPGDVTLMALFDPRTSAMRLNGTRVNPAGDQSEPLTPVLAVVASWLTLVAEERPLTEKRSRVLIRDNRALAVDWYTAPMTLPQSVLAQLNLLERHADWIAAQPWTDDYLTELDSVVKALRHAVRDHTHKAVGSCDLPAETGNCGGQLLAENGTGIVRCARCKASWVTAQEQARLAMRLG